MKIANYIINYAAIIFMAILPSCQKNSPEEPLGEEIEFALYSVEQVRASELTSNDLNSFGVFASLDETGTGFVNTAGANLKNFMDNIPVTDQGGIWAPTPKFYWPVDQNKKISFFAYAPYNSGYPEIVVPQQQPWTSSKEISITYTPNPNPRYQADLCVATAVLDKNGENKIDLDFDHTLSWISFAAKYKGFVPEGCYLRIDELTLNNVIGTNTLKYRAGETNKFSWETPDYSHKDGNYALSIKLETLGDTKIIQENYKEILTSYGFLYLLPQVINGTGTATKSSIDVTFSYVTDNTNKHIIAQFYTSKELPTNDELLPAHKYTYVFELDLEKVSLVSIGLEKQQGSNDGKWIYEWTPADQDTNKKPSPIQ